MKIEIGGKARGPLSGVRILDFTTIVSGPLCTQILGDLGADVVKIEPLGGDGCRIMGLPIKDGASPLFSQLNRNKRSMALDLKRSEGVETIRRMAAGADVLVENYRPGVADRLGIGYEALHAVNPDLIYVAISGFGPEGPYADLPAYDTVIQGLGGFMKIQGSAEAPLPIQGVPADKTSGLTAAYATIAALFARERARGEAGAAVAASGVAGQRVDVPMIDAWAAFSYVDMLGPESYLPAEHAPAGTPNTADFFQAFQTLDGFVVFMLVEDSQFQGFCQAIEREDLIDEPDYANIVLRMIHVPALIPTLKAEVRKWTTADLVERARRFGAPVAPVNGLPEFLEDPQVLANGTFFQTEDGERGTVRQIRQPARYSETPASVRHLVPRLGEHGSAVLAEAGFAQADIERLRADGVIL